MPAQSSVHFFLNWAKGRIDEMDATLASLESKAAEMHADARLKADRFIADMKVKRDEFDSTVKKQAEAGEAGWDTAKVRLETEWKDFQTETKKYLETFGKGIEQQQAVFQSQVYGTAECLARNGGQAQYGGEGIRHRAPAGNR